MPPRCCLGRLPALRAARPARLPALRPAAGLRFASSAAAAGPTSDDGARQGSLYSDIDFPKDDEGRVHHLSVREGEVAQRIVSVGDPTRAAALAALFDDAAETLRVDSHRPGAFTTFTGRFEGVAVSVIATGMGTPNMDFVVRECRGVVEGPMAIVRFGSCGIVCKATPPGSICVSTLGSINVTRNPDAFAPGAAAPEYWLSLPVLAHAELSLLLTESLREGVGEGSVVGGMNATCDSFYSSQGRQGSHFDDGNDDLIAEVNAFSSDIVTMEMETFQLLHLARSARQPMAAAAAVICVANRHTDEVIETEVMRRLESEGGRAVLRAITRLAL